jgi:diguanylate cyclase (GGDEF)-like protein/PAS domain S-box-containing protein
VEHGVWILAAMAALTLLAARLLQMVRQEREREEHFRSLVQHSSDLITLVGPDGMVRYFSPSVTRMLGYQPDELTGTPLTSLVHPDDVPATLAALRSFENGRPVESRLRHARGGWRHVESTFSHRDGLVVLNTRDVSERKELERQLTHQAFHDALTGLANRTLFADRAEHAIAGHRRDLAGVGVLYLDLDDFKTVNDTLGHAAGDELLIAAAKRLTTLSRPGDTVARLGGDEFALLVPGVGRPELEVVAQRISGAFAQPFVLAGQEVVIRASVGLALADEAIGTAADLLRSADLAMYREKNRGKGRGGDELDAELRRALEKGEFVLHYQPIVTLADGRVTGVEALVRWLHPVRGIMLPETFLAAAGQAGLLPVLGRSVLRAACQQLRAWGRPDGVALHINLSPEELRDPALPTVVTDALDAAGLVPADLVLEIGERSLDDADLLAELRAQGVRLAVDGFGSSLTQLRRCPVDVLKVDPLLVDGVADRADTLSLARAVMELGRTLRVSVVAKGVEREADARALRAAGWQLGQGFVLGPPQPAALLQRRFW